MKNKLLIGSVAQETGLSAKAIRYYEKVHVLPRPVRRTSDHGNGYRVYDAASIRRMKFVAHARKMQFSIPELRRLSRVVAGGCCGVIAPKLKTLLTEKVQAIEVQMAELTSLKQSLQGILDPAPTSQSSKASVMQAEDCSPSACAETVLGNVGEGGVVQPAAIQSTQHASGGCCEPNCTPETCGSHASSASPGSELNQVVKLTKAGARRLFGGEDDEISTRADLIQDKGGACEITGRCSGTVWQVQKEEIVRITDG